MSVVTPPMPYGLISILRLPDGTSIPTSDPACETRHNPAITLFPRAAEMGNGVR